MLLFRTKFNIAVLALSIVGSHLSAADAGYVAQAKQKASNIRDWSAQVAGKAREKANDLYASTREKANALYEKAKENKKLVAGAVAYLAYEAVGRYQGWNTPYRCLFELPGELAAANANLNTANMVTIPGLNANIVNLQNVVNGHPGVIANLNNAHQQNQLHITQLERQNELDKDGFTIVMKNIGEQIAQLNDSMENKTVRIAGLNNDLQASTRKEQNAASLFETIKNSQKQTIEDLRNQLLEAQNQYMSIAGKDGKENAIQNLQYESVKEECELARERIEELSRQIQEKDEHMREQIKAQVILEQTYNGVVSVLNNAQLQADDIMATLIAQAHALERCYCLVPTAYPNTQQMPFDLQDIDDQIVSLTKQAINQVIEQTIDDAAWLGKEIQGKCFDGDMNEYTCDEHFVNACNDIQELFDSIDQPLNKLIDVSVHYPMVKSCWASCNNESPIVDSLMAMLQYSSEKVLELSAHKNDEGNIVVGSYEDWFALYLHALIIKRACSSYEAFYARYGITDETQACLDSVRKHLDTLAPILDNIYATRVAVDENIKLPSSVISQSMSENKQFFSDMRESYIQNLNNSEINNFSLSKMFAQENKADLSSLSCINWDDLQKSFLGSENQEQETTIDDLLSAFDEQSNQKWEALFGSTNDLGNSSVLGLNSSILNSNSSMLNLNSSILKKSILNTQSIALLPDFIDEYKINQSQVITLNDSGLGKFNKDRTLARERREQMSFLSNRKAGSRVAYFGPAANLQGWKQSGINNVNNSGIHLNADSIIATEANTQKC